MVRSDWATGKGIGRRGREWGSGGEFGAVGLGAGEGVGWRWGAWCGRVGSGLECVSPVAWGGCILVFGRTNSKNMCSGGVPFGSGSHTPALVAPKMPEHNVSRMVLNAVG